MKKTLVALAALAATGAFAQSTAAITGNFGVHFASFTNTAGANFNGLNVTDGKVVFAAVEDLGGGMKAGANLDVAVRGRLNGVSGRDASVWVGGGFGTVSMGAAESANIIAGTSGAPTFGMDGGDLGFTVGGVGGISRSPLDGGVNIDFFKYTSPVFAGGMTVSYAYADSLAVNAAPPAGSTGGNEGASTRPSANGLALNYSNGPISFVLDYTKYSVNTTTLANVMPDSRTRIAGSYDFGVVKLGAGWQTKNIRSVVAGVTTAGTEVRNDQYTLGFSAPLGPVVVGMNWARNVNDRYLAPAMGDVTGTELGMDYALSKRTVVNMSYGQMSETNVAGTATGYRIRLLHSF
jgi:hypothetical protein